MQDLEKITRIADRFTSLSHFSKTPQEKLGLISIDVAIALGEYQALNGNLDLDAMLTGSNSDLVHDIMGIWGSMDCFTPRFAKH